MSSRVVGAMATCPCQAILSICHRVWALIRFRKGTRGAAVTGTNPATQKHIDRDWFGGDGGMEPHA